MSLAFKKEEIEVDELELDDLFELHDINKDGYIDIAEFKGMLKS